MYLVALLTQSNGPLKPLAIALGWLMNWIYIGIGNLFNVHNVALTIFVFTIVIYLFLLPLTYQQQKFSKMTMIMNPELKKIQKKYEGKRDQDSINKMNEETRAVYKKYGVSPSGSCIYLVIQLPILFALYRVIYNVPAYISSIKSQFTELVNGIVATPGYEKTMTSFFNTIKNHNYVYRGVSLNLDGTAAEAKNSLIDVLYKCTNANWNLLADKFPDLTQLIHTTQQHLNVVNDFLGVSVVYAPRVVIAQGFRNGLPIWILVGILIPVISAATQLINIRLMPQPSADMSGAGGMRIMNYLMPLYSFILVFFLPVGVGVYWIAGALIRSLQQWFFNRRLDRIDMEALIKKNQAKAAKKEKEKIEKKGVQGREIQKNASISTKNINSGSRSNSLAAKANSAKGKTGTAASSSSSGSGKHYRKNSMAAKANLVNDFNNGTLKVDNRNTGGKSSGNQSSKNKNTKNSGNNNSGGNKTNNSQNSNKNNSNRNNSNNKNSGKKNSGNKKK